MQEDDQLNNRPTPLNTQTPPGRSSAVQQFGRGASILFSWLIAILIAVGIRTVAYQPYHVNGSSMEPTLHHGDFLIISKFSYVWADIAGGDHLPQRGDIVVLQSNRADLRLIKRAIGLPGDRVVIGGSKIRIINAEHPEGFDPYEELGLPSETPVAGTTDLTVPDGRVFVIGDNRMAGGSSDSRNGLGPVPADNIIGKLSLRLFPFNAVDSF